MKLKSVTSILKDEPMPNPKYGYRCVYFLIKDDKIIYVGQTDELHKRLNSHKSKGFDRFNYIEMESQFADIVESVYIHLIRPELNGNIRNSRSKVDSNQMHAPISADRMAEMLIEYQKMKNSFDRIARTLGYRVW